MQTVATLKKLNTLLQSPHTTTRDLREVIVKDKIMTNKLIALTKSYGFPSEAWNVTSAITLLGFGVIRAMVNGQLNSTVRIH